MKHHNVVEREMSQQRHRLFCKVSAINVYFQSVLLYIHRNCWEHFAEGFGWNILSSVIVTK